MVAGGSHQGEVADVGRFKPKLEVKLPDGVRSKMSPERSGQPLLLGRFDAEHARLSRYFREVAGPRRHHDQPAAGTEHPGEFRGVPRREDHRNDVRRHVRDRKRLPDIADQVGGAGIHPGGTPQREFGNVQADGRRGCSRQ